MTATRDRCASWVRIGVAFALACALISVAVYVPQLYASVERNAALASERVDAAVDDALTAAGDFEFLSAVMNDSLAAIDPGVAWQKAAACIVPSLANRTSDSTIGCASGAGAGAPLLEAARVLVGTANCGAATCGGGDAPAILDAVSVFAASVRTRSALYTRDAALDLFAQSTAATFLTNDSTAAFVAGCLQPATLPGTADVLEATTIFGAGTVSALLSLTTCGDAGNVFVSSVDALAVHVATDVPYIEAQLVAPLDADARTAIVSQASAAAAATIAQAESRATALVRVNATRALRDIASRGASLAATNVSAAANASAASAASNASALAASVGAALNASATALNASYAASANATMADHANVSATHAIVSDQLHRIANSSAPATIANVTSGTNTLATQLVQIFSRDNVTSNCTDQTYACMLALVARVNATLRCAARLDGVSCANLTEAAAASVLDTALVLASIAFGTPPADEEDDAWPPALRDAYLANATVWLDDLRSASDTPNDTNTVVSIISRTTALRTRVGVLAAQHTAQEAAVASLSSAALATRPVGTFALGSRPNVSAVRIGNETWFAADGRPFAPLDAPALAALLAPHSPFLAFETLSRGALCLNESAQQTMPCAPGVDPRNALDATVLRIEVRDGAFVVASRFNGTATDYFSVCSASATLTTLTNECAWRASYNGSIVLRDDANDTLVLSGAPMNTSLAVVLPDARGAHPRTASATRRVPARPFQLRARGAILASTATCSASASDCRVFVTNVSAPTTTWPCVAFGATLADAPTIAACASSSTQVRAFQSNDVPASCFRPLVGATSLANYSVCLLTDTSSVEPPFTRDSEDYYWYGVLAVPLGATTIGDADSFVLAARNTSELLWVPRPATTGCCPIAVFDTSGTLFANWHATAAAASGYLPLYVDLATGGGGAPGSITLGPIAAATLAGRHPFGGVARVYPALVARAQNELYCYDGDGVSVQRWPVGALDPPSSEFACDPTNASDTALVQVAFAADGDAAVLVALRYNATLGGYGAPVGYLCAPGAFPLGADSTAPLTLLPTSGAQCLLDTRPPQWDGRYAELRYRAQHSTDSTEILLGTFRAFDDVRVFVDSPTQTVVGAVDFEVLQVRVGDGVMCAVLDDGGGLLRCDDARTWLVGARPWARGGGACWTLASGRVVCFDRDSRTLLSDNSTLTSNGTWGNASARVDLLCNGGTAPCPARAPPVDAARRTALHTHAMPSALVATAALGAPTIEEADAFDGDVTIPAGRPRLALTAPSVPITPTGRLVVELRVDTQRFTGRYKASGCAGADLMANGDAWPLGAIEYTGVGGELVLRESVPASPAQRFVLMQVTDLDGVPRTNEPVLNELFSRVPYLGAPLDDSYATPSDAAQCRWSDPREPVRGTCDVVGAVCTDGIAYYACGRLTDPLRGCAGPCFETIAAVSDGADAYAAAYAAFVARERAFDPSATSGYAAASITAKFFQFLMNTKNVVLAPYLEYADGREPPLPVIVAQHPGDTRFLACYPRGTAQYVARSLARLLVFGCTLTVGRVGTWRCPTRSAAPSPCACCSSKSRRARCRAPTTACRLARSSASRASRRTSARRTARRWWRCAPSPCASRRRALRSTPTPTTTRSCRPTRRALAW